MIRGHRWSPALLCLLPFALVFCAFQLAPLGYVALSAFRVGTGWGFDHFREIAASTFYRQAMWRSIEIALVSSLAGLLIATLACYGLSRVGGGTRRVLIAFTNMTSNFAGVPLAFAFIILLGANGALTLALQRFGLFESFSLYSRTGLMIIYTWFQVPLGMLLLLPAFAGLRSEWREAASLLGAGRVAYWRHIGLPVLWPSMMGTLTILLANAIGTYATVFALVGNNYNLLTIRIANLVSGDLFLQPELASALSLITIALLTAMTLVQQHLLRGRTHVE
ncbi:ABC transporter permease subunit [Salinicola corii]|uniref:ABC transporter permease subunit n=1 Tax=Salinicola corii TaxID=2606937 RepID=A0A640WIN7_9GAMM|nr:ABC transporter permease subunit [Salinicola corii]KAA0020411.1 ABC transporter permease subunit [Salinicola corii]